jgi:hypothetical protein
MLIFPAAVNAQRNAPEFEAIYASAAVGVADVEDRYLGTKYGDTPWSLQVSAGYRHDWIWSVEVAWQTFDDIQADDVRGSGVDRLNIRTSVNSASIRARLWFPISDFFEQERSVVAFVFGGAHATEISRGATEILSQSDYLEEKTDYGLSFGGGAIVSIGRFNLRGSVERIDLDDSDGSIVSSMIGLEFYF